MRPAILLAAFLLGLLAGVGLSGRTQDYVVISGLALHLDGARHCNTYVTPGIGYEHALSKTWKLSVGAYDNSNCKLSSYVAGAWLPLKYGSFKLGTISGLVSGYNNSILPVAGLVLSYEPKNRIGLNFLFIPPAGDTSDGIFWAQFKFPW